jgi:cellulose synthase/poly-beta-1,6-N-acetylglucosamine synthase-like glycosyltransferase
MVRWFGDSSIDAVCGNDIPLRARTPLQKVLAVTSHIGTGFVRRALSVIGVLPIITGNLGAIRKSILQKVGGFQPVWGEDLYLTFRLHKWGKRIIFDPAPIIRSDCPASLISLWKQRIRWVRSYLKISRIHAGLFRPRATLPFSIYLPFNYFTQIIIPILQILAVAILLNIIRSGGDSFYFWLNLLIFLGLFSFLAVAVYSVTLDRDWKALIYIPIAFFLIVPLSYFYNLVVAVSIWKEIRKRSGKK